jgi:hypothetical protein
MPAAERGGGPDAPHLLLRALAVAREHLRTKEEEVDMLDSMTIESQGDHEYVVRLNGDGEVVESWFRFTPELLAQMQLGDVDEETLVRRTVEFLLKHQSVPDFPTVVELEDVIATYDDYLKVVSA